MVGLEFDSQSIHFFKIKNPNPTDEPNFNIILRNTLEFDSRNKVAYKSCELISHNQRDFLFAISHAFMVFVISYCLVICELILHNQTIKIIGIKKTKRILFFFIEQEIEVF